MAVAGAREGAEADFDEQRCIDVTLGVYESLLGARVRERVWRA